MSRLSFWVYPPKEIDAYSQRFESPNVGMKNEARSLVAMLERSRVGSKEGH